MLGRKLDERHDIRGIEEAGLERPGEDVEPPHLNVGIRIVEKGGNPAGGSFVGADAQELDGRDATIPFGIPRVDAKAIVCNLTRTKERDHHPDELCARLEREVMLDHPS
jgi:hypothetical protein